MFESIGWLEIFTLLIVALIIVGPERLPGLIEDVRAAIFAARRAINNAKKELNEEFDPGLDEFRKPMEQVAQYTRLGPKAAITKALFDDDDSFLDGFDPKKMMEENPRKQASGPSPQPSQGRVHQDPPPKAPTPPPTPPAAGDKRPEKGDFSGEGFSWSDIT
ncbi:Sec-independent protein translocase protein TatB [Corynebacterium alimapuense]|uniref:Sec-independent protein translocase protein TatB n=1 Tax=Corynebacterium alimapuense TaxID=1576874 RepID=A0A3M8K5I9_9CORY|nr:Sec-independent protein translocase protein TatB [Corynebacterium alimapuense]RNE48456.1 twin-arginine translocase subunit TatB [Corynebacterium alimapuense]